MQIVSFVFFGFTALVFCLLLLSGKLCGSPEKRVSAANWILLTASYVFIIYADYRFALILALLTLSTWFCAKRQRFSHLGIIVALAGLCFFKYTNFFAESFAALFGMDFTTLNIILPLGISFYSFSAIGYIIDVQRGRTEARNLKDVALYLSFFPKLTSGPIQKSTDFFSQICRERVVGYSSFSEGIQIFAFGLFKKLVLADRLALFVNQVYETPKAFGSATVFFAVVSYSLQIYFDFSGYSDMAVGIARILGINLPRNFNLPYLAHNVSEFWKRWHITLSGWLMDYLYIPLGGNRKGCMRTYVNLILTMLIGGIWHGASWTFVAWGFLHGVALVVHKLWERITHSAENPHSSVSNILSILLTFLYVSFCWVFFRAESFAQAAEIIGRIFAFDVGLEQPYMWSWIALAILFAASVVAYKHTGRRSIACGAMHRRQNTCGIEGYYPLQDLTTVRGLTLFFVFCGLILCFASTNGSPFIYGKF